MTGLLSVDERLAKGLNLFHLQIASRFYLCYRGSVLDPYKCL